MAGMNRTLSGCCALFLSVAALAPASAADFVRIEGGTFEMGSEEFYREEGPVRQVTVRPFLISSTEVTNADFAALVAATGYVTTAARGPDPAEHPDWPKEMLQPGTRVLIMPVKPPGMADAIDR